MALSRSQKNAVFKAIAEAGPDPGDYYWDENNRISALHHNGSEFSCRFEAGANWYQVTYFPMSTKLTGHAERLSNFDAALQVVARWVETVQKETSEPDLWESMEQGEGLLGEGSSSDSPFVAEELAKLTDAVEEVKTFILEELKVSGEHAELVAARLKYLLEEARKQGKRDWAFIALGVLFNLATTVVAADQASELMKVATSILGKVYGSPPLLG